MNLKKSMSCPEFIHLKDINKKLGNIITIPKTNTFSNFTFSDYDLRLKSYGNYISKKQRTNRSDRRNAIFRFYKFMSKL